MVVPKTYAEGPWRARFVALHARLVMKVTAPSILSHMDSMSLHAWVFGTIDYYLSQQSSV